MRRRAAWQANLFEEGKVCMSRTFAVTSEVLTPEIEQKLIATSKKSILRHRHAACVVDNRGNAFSFKMNYKGRRHHAEIKAYEHFMRVFMPQGRRISYLIVVRVNDQDEFLNSKPCESCTEFFKNIHVPIFYSTGGNDGDSSYQSRNRSNRY